MKDRLDNLYNTIAKNIYSGNRVHPYIYCVELQDIIDDFNNHQEYMLQISMVQELLNRIKQHIKYNAVNFDAHYCQELKQIIDSLTCN